MWGIKYNRGMFTTVLQQLFFQWYTVSAWKLRRPIGAALKKYCPILQSLLYHFYIIVWQRLTEISKAYAYPDNKITSSLPLLSILEDVETIIAKEFQTQLTVFHFALAQFNWATVYNIQYISFTILSCTHTLSVVLKCSKPTLKLLMQCYLKNKENHNKVLVFDVVDCVETYLYSLNLLMIM